jgi:hypothetical protein
VRHQFRHVVCAKGEPVAASTKFGIKRPIGARSDASETGRSAAAPRHPGEEEKR